MSDPRSLLLTVNAPGMTGGIARLYLEYGRRFPTGRIEMLTTSPGKREPANRARDVPFPVHRLPFSTNRAKRVMNVVRASRQASRLVRDLGIDVVQVGDLRPMGYVGGWVGARRGVPYVVYVHGKDLAKEEAKAEDSRRGRVTGREILARAAAVVANSRFTAGRARRLMATLGVPVAGKIHVVHPGTDPKRFRPDPRAARHTRRRLSIGSRPMLLTVSRLVPRKGVDTLLAALPAIVERYPDVVLVVAGDGSDRARLEAEADRFGHSGRTRFLGEIPDSDLPGLYAAADLFVLPAREEPERNDVEGFGIVFSEAAACGVPAVGGDAGGVPEAVRDGETGLLVPPRDPSAVARAVISLLDDDARRTTLGSAARHWVEKYYNWERAAGEAWRIVVEAARP